MRRWTKLAVKFHIWRWDVGQAKPVITATCPVAWKNRALCLLCRKGDEQPAPASTAQACLQNFALGSAVDRDLCKCSERTTFLGTLYLSFARQFFYGAGFLINKECLIEHKGHSQRSLPRRVCSRWCCGSWCHYWQDDLYDLLFHHHR